MTAFIATVGILSAGALAALLSTSLGVEIALAVMAIIQRSYFQGCPVLN